MKKIWLLVSVLLLVAVTGCAKKESMILTSTEVLQKIEDKESFVVYLGTSTCSACITYKPIVKEMNKNYKVKIYEVILDEDKSEEDKKKLLEIFSMEYTPATFAIRDGVIVDSYEGLMDYEQLKEYMVKNEFIKEE